MDYEFSSLSSLSLTDRLRPLWPAIGIVGSFLITALFIFGGALVDRVRGKQGIDDDDGKSVLHQT